MDKIRLEIEELGLEMNKPGLKVAHQFANLKGEIDRNIEKLDGKINSVAKELFRLKSRIECRENQRFLGNATNMSKGGEKS